MRFLDKIFGRKLTSKKSSSKEEERGKFMPPIPVPTDERFLKNFKENDGKFLYCLNQEEVEKTFAEILKENNWHDEVCCFDKKLAALFDGFGLKFTENLEASFCLLPCEFLIANTGGVLLSSNQIGEKRLSQIPENIVLFAGVSQIVDRVDEGLRRINARKNESLPSNITAFQNFGESAEDDGHFLNYGSVSKNLYLLLLEDL